MAPEQVRRIPDLVARTATVEIRVRVVHRGRGPGAVGREIRVTSVACVLAVPDDVLRVNVLRVTVAVATDTRGVVRHLRPTRDEEVPRLGRCVARDVTNGH